MAAMARCLLVLCKQVQSIFMNEDRLIRLSSACYICKNKQKHHINSMFYSVFHDSG